MESLEEKYKNNSSLINSLEATDWITLLKEIALDYFPFAKNEELEAIKDAKNVHLEYSECGLSKILININMPNWEDYKIELNLHEILITKKDGHSNVENEYSIPIVVLRKLLKSKLCN